jgi:hypothetical protein
MSRLAAREQRLINRKPPSPVLWRLRPEDKDEKIRRAACEVGLAGVGTAGTRPVRHTGLTVVHDDALTDFASPFSRGRQSETIVISSG